MVHHLNSTHSTKSEEKFKKKTKHNLLLTTLNVDSSSPVDAIIIHIKYIFIFQKTQFNSIII
jgi:hypothetical protein